MHKQITKNQHIVPQRHLRQFSIDSDANKIKGFDCDNFLILKKDQSIKSVCCGYFHYALKPGEEDEYSQQVEDAFGNLEDWYGKNIERIEKLLLGKGKICTHDRFAISCIVANFYFRGEGFRKEALNTSKSLVDWLSPTVADHLYEEAGKKYPEVSRGNKEVFKKITDDELFNEASKTCYATQRSFDVGLANTLTHKSWEIFINNSDYPFITSDEAVIDLINNKIPNRLNGAWLLKTQIFNLSPRISIVFSFYPGEDMHGATSYKDISSLKEEIFRQNLYYIKFSNKYAYSGDVNFFEEFIVARNSGKFDGLAI
jgi:hypothetical protein